MRLMLDATAVPAKPVGAGVYTLELARHLAPHVDLTLAVRRNDAVRWAEIAPGATVFADAPDRRPLRLAWEQTGSRKTARAAGAEVWHGPHYTLPLRMNLPRVVTVHDLTFIERPEWHESAKVQFFRRMMRAALRRADVIIAVSEYTAARTDAVLGPHAPIITIPHGVDHENFRPGTVGDPQELAQLAAYGVRPPYVAFTGTHEPRKNIPGLISAFDAVAADHPDLTLVLSGPTGWGADDVERAISACGAADRIVRPGRLPYALLPSFFRQAEVVAYPSFNEGFGLPALETLASGGVLLSTSGSAVETFVADAACLVRPGDTADLANALDALLRDDEARSTLRHRGPVVAGPFTWKRCATAHIDAYERATGVST